MIKVDDNGVTLIGTYADLDSEIAVLLVQYASRLQKEGLSKEQISHDLLTYMKLLKVITECVVNGQSVEDECLHIVDKVFEQLKYLN